MEQQNAQETLSRYVNARLTQRVDALWPSGPWGGCCAVPLPL